MKSPCCVCQKPSSSLLCAGCSSPVCKTCAQFLDDQSFHFAPDKLSELLGADQSEAVFCSPCFDQKISPSLSEYEANLDRAKNVFVFFKTQSKETRLIKRREDIVKIAECNDYDEAILRLAFQAALIDCNALVDVSLDSKKVKLSGYTTTQWFGEARPARVEERQLSHDRVILKNPN
jgi:hypothetical protein